MSIAQTDFEYTTGRIHANGLNFSFIEAGEGPLVLAFHGFPDLPRTFRHQIRALATAGYRVVAPYMRGYAPTDIPADGPYAGAVLVQDASASLRIWSFCSALQCLGFFVMSLQIYALVKFVESCSSFIGG